MQHILSVVKGNLSGGRGEHFCVYEHPFPGLVVRLHVPVERTHLWVESSVRVGGARGPVRLCCGRDRRSGDMSAVY